MVALVSEGPLKKVGLWVMAGVMEGTYVVSALGEVSSWSWQVGSPTVLPPYKNSQQVDS